MTYLTDKELTMLKAFILEGINTNGAETAEELLEDNMTWMSAADLKAELGWSYEAIGGVMGSLEAKGMIVDSGESARGAAGSDWFASDKAIKEFFDSV